MLKFLCRCCDSLSAFFGKLASWLCVLLVLVTVTDVLLRYLFHSGSVAVQELEWHLFGLIFLFGLAKTYQDDEHVRVDIIYARLSTKSQAWINLIGTLIFLLPLSAIIIWSSLPFVEAAYRLAEQSADPGGLPYRFLIKASIPLGFVLLLLQAIASSLRSLQALRFREAPK